MLQEIIQDYDEKGMGIKRPKSGHRRQRSRLSGSTDSADIRHSDSLDEQRSGDVGELQGAFAGTDQVPMSTHC